MYDIHSPRCETCGGLLREDEDGNSRLHSQTDCIVHRINAGFDRIHDMIQNWFLMEHNERTREGRAG